MITTSQFLKGNDKMGTLFRSYNWRDSPLGEPENWPLGLKISLSTVLSSGFPMLLLWGEEFHLFYNDAFSLILDQEEAPAAPGHTGRNRLAETLPGLPGLADQVMRTGEGIWIENQLIHIRQKEHTQDTFWNFNYTAIPDENGVTGGVLIMCQESAKTPAERSTEGWFRKLVQQAPMAVGIFSGENLVIEEGNEKLLGIWGWDKSIIGKPVTIAPAMEESEFFQLLRRVHQSGEPLSALDIRESAGAEEEHYYDYVFLPIHDESGVARILALVTDVTAKVKSQKALEASESKFRSLIEQVPVGISVFAGKDMVVELANGPMLGYWGKDESAIGKTLREAMPELDGQPFHDLLADIYENGHTFSSENAPVDIEVNGAVDRYYFNFTYKPLLDDAGKVYAIIDMSLDVTRQMLAQKALEASEATLRTVIAAVPFAMGVLRGRDLVIELPNKAFTELIGKERVIAGLPLAEALKELAGNPILQTIDEVFTSGKMFEGFGIPIELERNGKTVCRNFNLTYIPLFNDHQEVDAVLGIAIDVTERLAIQNQIEESQRQLLALFEQSPVAIAMLRREDLRFTMANPFYGVMAGRKPEDIVGKTLLEALPELHEQGFEQLLKNVIETGKPFSAKEQPALVMHQNELVTIYVDVTYQPQRDLEGTITGAFVVATDVTEQVAARKEIERAESTLRSAVELAELGTYELDFSTGLLDYSDRLKEWFGIPEGEKVFLKAIYHTINKRDLPRVTEAFRKATSAGSEGHYNAEFTITSSHNRRERIVHDQARVFFDENGEPAVMIGTVQDVTAQRQIQLALEQKVQERTEELEASNEEMEATNEELASINEEYMAINEDLNKSNHLLARSNENLQQFAYVASHDLQEPLRKIQAFGDMLQRRYAGQLGDGQDLVIRMQSAASRMSVLIEDLLSFSRISVTPANNDLVPLNTVVEEALGALEYVVQESGAEIRVDALPTVPGDQSQLRQLFQNLLSNALKFRRPGVVPKIEVRYTLVEDGNSPQPEKLLTSEHSYHRIDVVDNGIGFDNRYAERIFQVFQRLHGKVEFAGTGIGLAICEKVVANHSGAITATGRTGKGATFSVFLPNKS
jgi:PAS domain S-box-containing protein